MKLGTVDYQKLLTPLLNSDGRFRTFDSISPAADQIRPRDILLRHDIDDNIDAAVSMAQVEAEMGIFSTYFMLDTTPYFYLPESVEKYRMIAELGHEIGWHNNALATWYKRTTDIITPEIWEAMSANEKKHAEPIFRLHQQFLEDKTFQDMESIIRKPLLYLRETCGLTITSTAAHGDPACYEGRFVNWQIWKGWPKMNNLPHDQYQLNKFGLKHEAYRYKWDWYLSDSGGSWSVPDPVAYINKWIARGIVPIQILIHSQWWR